jgi:ribose-phosphate pyrophosphokinase
MATRFQGPEFRNAAIVSPDVGRAKLAGKFAEMLGLPLVVMHKRRTSPTKVEPTHVVGDIQGKTPIVIDDVIAGGSVLDEVNWLLGAGARPEVHFAITHGVLLPSALERLERNEAIKKLVISDTIAQPDRVRSNPKIEVISVADLLADAIDRIHNGVSISSLIEKALA